MKTLRTFFLLLLVIASAFGQATQQPKPQPEPPQPEAQPQHHITKAEADELFRAVDEILKFDSERTGLPIKHEVKRRLISRDEVQKFFLKEFQDDESAKRLTQAELVLKRFGLIPRDSSLKGLLLALYTESVAGYYDPKTKTVNLLDWLDPESQKPVLAHELTHALQDQNFDMRKFFKFPKPKKGEYDVTTSEQQSARVAVMEGQAAATMVDYLLSQRGLSLATAPDVGRAIQSAMLTASEGEPTIFAKAPLYLREDMKFPYTYGLGFTLDLLKQSKEMAFAEPFRNPPLNTRQIMQPETYLAKEVIPPLPMPDLDRVLGKDWERFDVDSVGEFDISILAREYGRTVQQATAMAHQWRNSYYYAANKKGIKPETPGDIAVLYVSRWASSEAANEWADIYAGALGTRYKKIAPVAPGHWTSEEGDVFIQRAGDCVLITEGFAPDVSTKLRDAALTSLTEKSPTTND